MDMMNNIFSHPVRKLSHDQQILEGNSQDSSEDLAEKCSVINISDAITLLYNEIANSEHPDVIPLESRGMCSMTAAYEDPIQEDNGKLKESPKHSISKEELAAHINLGLDMKDELDHSIFIENENHIKLKDENDNPVGSLTRLNEIKDVIVRKTTLQFLIYAVGICFFFILGGLFSEKLLRGKFGPTEDKFSFICVYVFVQNVVNHIYAEILLCTLFKKDEDKTEKKFYAVAACCNCISMYLANKSLHWINYPMQVLAKSMRPIPVMIFNVIIGKQRYSLKKYCFVMLVVIGVSLFAFKNNDPSKSDLQFKLGWGELCVVISLIFDGITGAFQERMRQDFHTQPGHFMSNLNKWAMLYVGIGMFVSQEVPEFCRFMIAHPISRYYLTAISACSALGQTFIFLMISHFGSLSCSLVTTTRKFFTILGSIIIFRHSMSTEQLVATCLVFLGLFLDTYFTNKEHRMSKARSEENES